MKRVVKTVPSRWRIAHVAERIGLTDGLLRLRRHAGSPWVPILTWHRVQPRPDENPFDDGVVDATPDELERQIATLVRHFDVVDTDALCDWVAGRGTLPPNPVAVTFDDGYLDNYEHALPILRRHGVRAIFFIATRYVGERRMFWWDRIAYLMKQARTSTVELDYPARFQGDLRAVLRVAKDHFGLDLERFMEGLQAKTGVHWDDALERRFADEQLMTWDHVRALRDAGMDVQSHTRTHRVLHTLSPAELADELAGSRQDLELALGQKVRAVSYPVGKPIASRPPIRAAVRAAGYEIGLSNGSGVNHRFRHPWRSIDRYDLRRLAMDRGLPDSYFRGVLALPYLAA